MKTDFAAKMNNTKLMVSGLTSYSEQLKRRGIDEEFINELKLLSNEIEILNNEQEHIKSELKAKTLDLRNKLKQMNKKYSEAKKLVKIEIPQIQWLSFGINDKR